MCGFKVLKSSITWICLATLLATFVGNMGDSRAAGVIYVNKNAGMGGNGASWGTAYKYLQDALSNATAGDEIWVARGVYYPDEDESGGVTDNDRNASFVLKSGVGVYGGFIGTETGRSQRDSASNTTVLSGDIDQNDSGKVNDVLQSHTGITGNNSYHVVRGTNVGSTATLDGFSVTGGDAGTSTNIDGAGIWLDRSTLALVDLEVRGNRASGLGGRGGGIFAEDAGHHSPTVGGPHMSGLVVRNNLAEYAGGGIAFDLCGASIDNTQILENEVTSLGQSFCLVDISGGGGLFVTGGSQVFLHRVVFEENVGACFGGGMVVWNTRFHIQGGAFVNNRVRDIGVGQPPGGGLHALNSSRSSIDNVLFVGNRADGDGGAISINYTAGRAGTTNITNSTIVANAADRAGAIEIQTDPSPWFPGATSPGKGRLNIHNTIIWNNDSSGPSEIIMIDNSIGHIGNSLVQDSNGSGPSWNANLGIDDGGNMEASPGFIQPPAGSAPTVTGDFRLALGSPAIDTGLNSAATSPTDNLGHPRIFNSVVDMGAYELPIVCPGGGVSRLYVDDTATGSALGTSWADAIPRLQNALTLAEKCPGGAINEIWVAAGVYYPDEGTYQTDGDRSAAFQLRNSLSIYGGFRGTETNLSQRTPWDFISTLSGDIDQNDITDAHSLVETPTNIVGDNSYHVALASNVDSTARLDGFAVTAGYANGSAANQEHEGGGLFAESGSPTLNNLALVGNIAQEGGAMSLAAGSNPTISNAWFGSNAASDFGGALYNEGSNPSLTNALFSGNRAAVGGGAIYNRASSPNLVNATIAGNMAGGIVNLGQGRVIIQAFSVGGGMYNDLGSKPDIRNSVIWNNRDDTGTGTASANIKNGDVGSQPIISYSDVQGSGGSGGGWTGSAGFDYGNNIDQDPLYVIPLDPANSPSFAGDHHLLAGSPAIDTGNNADNSLATDLGQKPRIQGAAIDMGAFEATPTAHIALHKSVSSTTAKVGQVITYTYQVVNTGPGTLTSMTLTDDKLGTVTLDAASIISGATTSGILTAIIKQGDLPGPLTNTAVVAGTSSVSGTLAATDTASISLSEQPRLELTLTPNPARARPGITINNTYRVTNTGDVTLSGVTVLDTQLGAVTLDKTTLAPGESASGVKSYTVQSSASSGWLWYTATGSGVSPTGKTATRQVSAAVALQSTPGGVYLPVIYANH